MNTIDFLREQLPQADEFLAGTLADIDSEGAHAVPPGAGNSIAATYAHLVTGEDGFVSGLLRGAAPGFAAAFNGNTGLSELPPASGDWHEWGRTVRVDLPRLRRYAAAVSDSTDSYLASLTEDGLDRNIDLSAFGFDTRSLGWVLGAGVLGHRLSHWGEICALNGLRGGRGFPR